MYVPHFNAVDESTARAMVEAYAAGEVITTGPDGYPLATLLPVLWQGDRVIAHMARANEHWRSIDPDTPVLVVVGGPQAYVSPSWYAAKAEHGKVVPTWNYSSVHLTGRATVHDDPEWVRGAVTDLTDRHESPRDEPWRVTDPPASYVDGMLKAIVGIEIHVERAEGKAKLSQNRSRDDQQGVVAGLGADDPVAEAMRENLE
ncbi:MAG: FMN-binding negative transcriptional regulator [Nocardioidaceae bacterium]|nr:FMN-binding negative transcriptional regulator [Nocardioidaceae bacterium]MCL2614557.1 FMN-binding negative transcriptional regulator [Nocardioidaceae bacterium]